jgi:hypothetical protein
MEAAMEANLRSCGLGVLLLLVFGLPAFSQYGRSMPGGRGRVPSTLGTTVPNEPLASFTGAVENIDKKKITVQESESNTLQFVCSRKTQYYDGDKKIKLSDIKPGDRVTVETKRLADGEMEAINVHIEHPKAEARKAS